MPVTSIPMTVQARDLVAIRAGAASRRIHGVHHIGMALAASCLGHAAVALCHLDGIGKTAGGEKVGMPKAVLGFGPILRQPACGCMTVVARGHSVMAPVLPSVVLFPHDMAIHAGLRIIRQVGITPGRDEGVGAGAQRNAHHDTDRNAGPGLRFHGTNQIRIRLGRSQLGRSVQS